MNKKFIVFIILILLLIAGGIFCWWQERKETPKGKLESQLQELEKQKQEAEKQLKEVEEIGSEELAEKLIEAMTPLPLHTTEDQELEGVTIIKQGDKKIIKNEAQGYSIEVPANLILTRSRDSAHIEFHDPETMCYTPQCYPVIGIYALENTQKISLKEFVQQRVSPSEIITQLTINGTESYKVELKPEDSPRGIGDIAYYLAKEDKIYLISTGFEEIAKTFKFE